MSTTEDASSTGSISEDASSTGSTTEDASSTGSISEDASSTGRILGDASCSVTLETSNLQCPSLKRMKIAEEIEVPSSSVVCSDSTSGDEDVTVPYIDTDYGLC